MSHDGESRIEGAQTLLGVRFHDPGLLVEALTHPSYAAEHDGAIGYDRLEFLGDSVMGFIVAEHLFATRTQEPEGVLTRLKIGAVAGETLAVVAERLGIGPMIRMGKGAARSGGRSRSSVLENCLEAIIGAVYLDQGMEVTRDLVFRLLDEYLDGTPLPQADPKSALQELVQAQGAMPPAYRVISTSGPPHDRTFVAQVLVDERPLGTGEGASKKDAEKAAAADALRSLEDRG